MVSMAFCSMNNTISSKPCGNPISHLKFKCIACTNRGIQTYCQYGQCLQLYIRLCHDSTWHVRLPQLLFICLEVDCRIALTYLICLLGLIVAFRQHISDASSYISVVVRLSQNIQIISILCLLDQRTSWFNLCLSNIVSDMAYALLKLLKVDNILYELLISIFPYLYGICSLEALKSG